jgi:putative peptide zinc metalloprotease protein
MGPARIFLRFQSTAARKRLAAVAQVLIVFGYGTWLYRVVLFIGIAVLVYELFFKLLGIALMFVEIRWFVARPVVREVGEWVGDRRNMRMNGSALRSLMLLIAIISLLFFPWRQEVAAPALMQAALRNVVTAPRAAQVAMRHQAVGDGVSGGDALFTLISPELTQQIKYALLERSIVQSSLDMSEVDQRLGQCSGVLKSQLEEVNQRLATLQGEAAKLMVVAPFDGRVTALADVARKGTWVAKDEALAHLVQPGKTRLSAYVMEEDLKRIEDGAIARFYPSDPELPPSQDCHVEATENTAVSQLDVHVLASVYGGPLDVVALPSGALVPERAVYRVLMGGCTQPEALRRVLPGSVQIAAQPASLFGRAWYHAYGVFLRESGFQIRRSERL